MENFFFSLLILTIKIRYNRFVLYFEIEIDVLKNIKHRILKNQKNSNEDNIVSKYYRTHRAAIERHETKIFFFKI